MSQSVTDRVTAGGSGDPAEARATTPTASRRTRLTQALAWPTALVVTVVVFAAVPLLFHQRYYFSGDTQAGAVGQWYHLGTQLRAGHWPLLDLATWRAGNFIAEGQWGLFSPLTILFALLTTVVPNLVVFVTVLKTGLLVAGALGLYLLARSYGATRPAAYLGGAAVAIGGATQYLESPSWVTGQMVWALLPWTWWSFRRLSDRSTNPAPALLFGFLIVTVGYVYGTLYLIVVILACLLDAAVARRRDAFVRVFVAGALSGLVALTVYLPGLMTASVTTRGTWEVLSTGRLQGDVPGLLASMLPMTMSPAAAFAPVSFVAWFLPMLFWLDRDRVRALFRPMLGAYLVLVIFVAWTVGPNQVGPIRWPLRVMPEVVLAAVLVTVVLLSQALVRRPSRGALLASGLWVLAAGYLVVSRFWTEKAMTSVSVLVVLLGLALMWFVVRRHGFGAVAAGVGVAVCLVTVVLQHAYYPLPSSADRNMSAVPSDYRGVASDARGDLMLIGDPEKQIVNNPRATRDQLVGSSWFLTDKPVQSVYSTIGFTEFNRRYCFIYNGGTCPAALGQLFTREPTTGLKRVDLLSVSSLHLNRRDFPREGLLNPPEGWSIGGQSRWAVTWVRDEVLPTAGGVVWTTPGLEVDTTASSTRKIQLDVDSVPTGGGQVVFSRLAWPGYTVDGASLSKRPVDRYLVAVDVPESAAGKQVTLSYSPPGWRLEVTALVLALVLGALWSLAVAGRPLIARLRSRR